MTALSAAYCPACGEPVATAEKIAAADGAFADVCQGTYRRDAPDSHVTVEGQTVSIYVHEESET